MRAAVLSLVIVCGIVLLSASGLVPFPVAFAERPGNSYSGRSGISGEVVAFSADLGDGSQQIVVIDPKARTMGVYHVARSSGQVALKSVRNIHWDLQMDEFNAGSPSPQEIRALLDSR